ncbi:MAG: hypothetical protein IJC57_04120 [Clostridia bacterium]|nr:hypothetical protein [Clostridia bacterium]
MNKTFKKIFSVCYAVVTTLTATLFHSTNLSAGGQKRMVFMGPQGTGKSKLFSRIYDNSYYSNYAATIGWNFVTAGQIKIWDTTGDSRFLDTTKVFLRDASLCVLFISNTNQKTEDFLNVIAESQVPNVVLCITKTDEGVPDSEAVRQLLGKIKQELQKAKVFDEVLYTSAQNNKFRFCTPDTYKASDEYQIYDTKADKQVLAAKLYELCGRKAEEPSYDEHKTTTSKGKTYALGLGIPVALLPLILGIGYYEYDRHFRKPAKTKTETKSEQTPKANRKISS